MRRGVRALAALGLALGVAPAAAQSDKAARAEAFAKLPDWSGYWLTENDETSIGGLAQRSIEARTTGEAPARAAMPLFGFNAPWNEAGRKLQAGRNQGGGRKAEGWGYPMMMNAAAPLQFLITPEEVLIINAYRDVRHVYTDGRKLPGPDDSWPTVWGESVGHWEGDTLVIETIQVRNPNQYFHGSPVLSEAARYVERIRKVGNRIVNAFVITDPATLSEPWAGEVVYQPAEGFDRMISIDYDNDRTNYEDGESTIKPPSD